MNKGISNFVKSSFLIHVHIFIQELSLSKHIFVKCN